MTNAIQVSNTSLIKTYDDAERAAKAMSASGFFQDSRQAAQAIVKILAGQELGFGAFASMTGVHIIKGKPTLASNLLAAAVKRTGKYNYRVQVQTEEVCVLDWYEDGKRVGESSFTIKEAQRAGLAGKDNWKNYPSDMLFARAISRGQKRYAPDIFNGATVYTPDELGAETDQDGQIINGEIIETPEPKQDSTARPYPPEDRPYSAEDVKKSVIAMVKKYGVQGDGVSEQDRKVLASTLNSTLEDETKRYELCKWLVGVSSVKEMSAAQVKALLVWQGVSGFGEMPSDDVLTETRSCHTQALKEAGQQELI